MSTHNRRSRRPTLRGSWPMAMPPGFQPSHEESFSPPQHEVPTQLPESLANKPLPPVPGHLPVFPHQMPHQIGGTLPHPGATPRQSILTLVNDELMLNTMVPVRHVAEFGDVDDISRPHIDSISVRSVRSLKSLKSARLHQKSWVQSPCPPNIPPPVPSSTVSRVPTTHLAIHHHKNRSKSSARWNAICSLLVLASVLLLLVLAISGFLVLGIRAQTFFKPEVLSNPNSQFALPSDAEELGSGGADSSRVAAPQFEISPNHLLTLLITKRKVCLFEAATDDYQQSRDLFTEEHIESARLLYPSNISHSGVPVHPLQFQRIARAFGVDMDCQVVIYDRGHIIWSTYIVWIFKLFGQQRVLLLTGGFEAWKAHQAHSAQYKTERGVPPPNPRLGNMIAAWNNSLVTTFDDVLANSESERNDIVDAQTKEEYAGNAQGALYGHIRGAISLPIEKLYNYNETRWRSSPELLATFRSCGLSKQKPIVWFKDFYCYAPLFS